MLPRGCAWRLVSIRRTCRPSDKPVSSSTLLGLMPSGEMLAAAVAALVEAEGIAFSEVSDSRLVRDLMGAWNTWPKVSRSPADSNRSGGTSPTFSRNLAASHSPSKDRQRNLLYLPFQRATRPQGPEGPNPKEGTEGTSLSIRAT